MRGFVLLSYAVCLVVARPQYNYEQGNSQQYEAPQAIAASAQTVSAPFASANGQLDQSTLDILRSLSSVPTSPSFLLHESHQTLTNALTNAVHAQPLPALQSLQSVQSLQAAPLPQALPSPVPQSVPASLPQALPVQQIQPQLQYVSPPQFSSVSFPQPSYQPQPLSQSSADIPSTLATLNGPSISTDSTFAAPSFPASAPSAFTSPLAAPLVAAPPAVQPPPPPPPPAQTSSFYHPAQLAQFSESNIKKDDSSAPTAPSGSIAPLTLAEPQNSPAQPVLSEPSVAPLALAPVQQPQISQPSPSYQPLHYPEPITTIHKHIYVHVPPAEFEEEPEQPRVRLAPANNHKHVQILFIRAPSPPTPKPIEFPPLATNEEKTLVYVLVKKPEIPDEIVPPITPETKQHKPEVYFIKYQGDKDVQQKVQEAENSVTSDAILTQPADAANPADSLDVRSNSNEVSSQSADNSQQSNEQLTPLASSSSPSASSSDAAADIPSIQDLPLSSSSPSLSSLTPSLPSAQPDREYIPAA